jgi:hypothetical protein
MQQWSPTSRLRQHSDGAGRCGPPVGVGSGLQARASGRPVLWASKRQALAVSFPFSYGSSFHYHSNFFYFFLIFFPSVRLHSIFYFPFCILFPFFSCSQVSSMGSSSWGKNYNIETKKSGLVSICTDLCGIMHAWFVWDRGYNFVAVFLQVFKACFKCFIYLLLYIVSVAFECFESISGKCSGFPSGWI